MDEELETLLEDVPEEEVVGVIVDEAVEQYTESAELIDTEAETQFEFDTEDFEIEVSEY
jgi:hypothetical protein